MPKLRRLVETPPDARGNAEEQLRDLRDYLIGVTEELEYVLTHLEAENIDDTMWERISALIPKPYGGAPLMDGTSSAGGSRNYARGDHRHPRDNSKADEAALNAHTGNTSNPHGVTKAQVGLGNVDDVQQYSATNPPPYPVTSVNGATGAVTVAVPAASSANPQMDGTAAAGSSGDYARADHVHPTDTGRAPKAHASSGTDYGIGSDANYGHLRLSNQTNQQSGVTGGIAATPMAVKAVYDLASGKADPGDIPSAYTSNPAMDGTASPGSSTSWAKGDHVHPSDTRKLDVAMFQGHTLNYSNPHRVTASQVGAADAESYPDGSITLLTGNGYISAASLSACDRAGSIVAIAISINLAGQIPTTRCEFGTLSGVPKPRANTAGLFQITNYLFSVQIATNGKVYIESIGQAQGASTWSGTPMLTYSTDGTLLS